MMDSPIDLIVEHGLLPWRHIPTNEALGGLGSQGKS